VGFSGCPPAPVAAHPATGQTTAEQITATSDNLPSRISSKPDTAFNLARPCGYAQPQGRA
jgi:hypothetical protein